MSDKHLFTIGFTRTSAREFFTKLEEAGVGRIIDIRLRNTSQLAGFAKCQDLRYFLDAICGVGYVHRPELAPTKELLTGYKKDEISWDRYEEQYLALAKRREMASKLAQDLRDGDCLLCSERTPEHCHRRLLAEHLRDEIGGLEICHL